MSSLKGSDYLRQVKNAQNRLFALSKTRHQTDSKLSHSCSIMTKRQEYLNSISEYMSSKYGEGDKLNTHFTDEKLGAFLRDRLNGDRSDGDYSDVYKVNYARGVSALIDGLKQTNITASVSKDTFNKYVKEIKERASPVSERNDYIPHIDRDAILSSLEERSLGFYLTASIQSLTGLRVSEARRICESPSSFISNNSLVNIAGKGGKLYDPLPISNSLYEILNRVGSGVSVPYSSYAAALKDLGIHSHKFRTSYVRDRMQEKLNSGVEYRQALRDISSEINHSRESITEFYLNNSGF